MARRYRAFLVGQRFTPENRERNKAPSLENITIDVGASSKEEVEEMGIEIGNVIIFDDHFFVLNKNKYVCRALDNRAGGFMISQVAKQIFENKDELPFTLYVVNSVQEEVGLYGATMATQNIKPDIALVTDVTHDTTTPMIDAKKEGDGKLGEGPMIFTAPSIQNNLRKMVQTVAKENGIKYQRGACSRASGTDTDAFAFSNGGVVSALVSLPLRYMHTTVEMVQKEDVEAVVELLYQSLKNIKSKAQFKYHDEQIIGE